MNFKKFISGISALTIAASTFAGLAVTANAATSIYSENFENGTVGNWTSVSGSVSAKADEATVNKNSSSYVLLNGRASGSRTAGVYPLGNSGRSTGVYKVSFDLRMDVSNSTQTNSLRITGAKETKNWFQDISNGGIFYFEQTSSGGGTTLNSSTYSVNGVTKTGINTATDLKEGSFRDTTGWLRFDVIVDMDNKTESYTITRKSSNAVLATGSSTFTTDKLLGIETVAVKSYGGVFMDNIEILELTRPAFTLEKTAVDITDFTTPATVSVTDITGDISVESQDASVATASYSNGVVTINGISDGATTVVVTGTNDGISVTENIAVTAGEPETTDVTLNYVSNGTPIAQSTTVKDVTVGSMLDLTAYTSAVTSYTDASGVVYTATYNGLSEVSVTEDLSYDLEYTLTENNYDATVNTVYHARVNISGTSTSGQTIDKTVYSNYSNAVGTATATLPVGTYTVTVTKNGYTFNAGSLTVSNGGANSTTVSGTINSGYLFYEDFDTAAASANGTVYDLLGVYRHLSLGQMQTIKYGDVTVPFVNTCATGTKVTIDDLYAKVSSGVDYTHRIKFNGTDGTTLLTLKVNGADFTVYNEAGDSKTLFTDSNTEDKDAEGKTADLVINFNNGKATGSFGEVDFDLSVTSDTVASVEVIGANSNAVVIQLSGIYAEPITPPDAPTSTFVAANWESTVDEYKAEGNTLTDSRTNAVVYGYKTDITGNDGYSYTVKGYIKSADSAKDTTLTLGTITDASPMTFYLVTDEALDLDASNVYCE